MKESLSAILILGLAILLMSNSKKIISSNFDVPSTMCILLKVMLFTVSTVSFSLSLSLSLFLIFKVSPSSILILPVLEWCS